MKLNPKQDYLLVDPCEFAQDTLVHRPDISKDAPDRGIIVALGPRANLDPDTGLELPDAEQLSRGDIVMFGKYSSLAADDEFVFIRARDVIATVENVKIAPKKEIGVGGQLEDKPHRSIELASR